MRNKGWSAIALAMALTVMLFTASCAKKVVRTESQTQTQPQAQSQIQPVSTTGPEVRKTPTEPEVRKAPEKPAVEAKPDGRLDEVRLRAESAARLAALTTFVDENIHFAFDSSLLSDQARQTLISKAKYLRTNPDITVTVAGHCDDRGTNAYNIALGERRAESVKMFLVNLGIGTNRLNTVSYGKERPIATEHDEASWAENRRAQFVIN